MINYINTMSCFIQCNATRILLIGLRGVNMCMVEISCLDRVDIITTIHDSFTLYIFVTLPFPLFTYQCYILSSSVSLCPLLCSVLYKSRSVMLVYRTTKNKFGI